MLRLPYPLPYEGMKETRVVRREVASNLQAIAKGLRGRRITAAEGARLLEKQVEAIRPHEGIF